MTLSALGASYCLHGVTYDRSIALFGAALLFGLMSASVFSVINLPHLQSFFSKIGLFSFLSNAFLFFLVSKIIPGFHLDGFSTALWGSFLIGLISFVITIIASSKNVSSTKESPKMKPAKAKVISSKKNP